MPPQRSHLNKHPQIGKLATANIRITHWRYKDRNTASSKHPSTTTVKDNAAVSLPSPPPSSPMASSPPSSPPSHKLSECNLPTNHSSMNSSHTKTPTKSLEFHITEQAEKNKKHKEAYKSCGKTPSVLPLNLRCPIPGCISRTFKRFRNPTKAWEDHLFNQGYKGDMDHRAAYEAAMQRKRLKMGRRRAEAAIRLSGEKDMGRVAETMAWEYAKEYEEMDWETGIQEMLFFSDDDYE